MEIVAAGSVVAGGVTSGTLFTRTETGNKVLGDYIKNQTVSENYNMQQIRGGTPNFLLVQAGENSFTLEEIGNTWHLVGL